MLVIKDTLPMDNSGFFVQGAFGSGPESIPIVSSSNISPSHQNALSLNHSSSESNMQRTGGSIHHAQAHHSASNSSSGNNNERSSPLHLASMLNSLSMGGTIHSGLPQQSQSSHHSQQDLNSMKQNSYLLKLKNVPSDMTIREAHAVFALANGVSNVEILKEAKNTVSPNADEVELSIVAKFNSLPLATHYASILSSKNDIFGPTFSFSPYVEIIDELANQQIPFHKPKFNYQLSSPGMPISPVTSIQQVNLPNQPHRAQSQGQAQQQGQPQVSSQSQGQTQPQGQSQGQPQSQSHSQPPSQQQQQQQQSQGPSQPQAPQQISPVSAAGNINRPGLVQTRSRFSFSDPFSSSNETAQQSQAQQRTNSASQTGSHITHSRSHQDPQSTDVGKSLLLMENDDINDSIWGTSAMPTSMNGFTSTPQPSTPILEWGSSGRKQSSSFFLSQTGNSTANNDSSTAQNVDVTSSMHSITGNPNNTGSITSPFSMLSQVPNINGQSNIPSVLGGRDSDMTVSGGGVGSRKHGVYKQPSQSSQLPTSQQSQQQPSHESQQSQDQQSSSQNTTPQKGSQVRSTIRSTHPSNGSQKNSISNPSSSTNVAGSTTISQADLSLLARVPPPANPADQNPPCNTLYVGNLPPDTTEQELRQLFSGQQGFRRLSFRNKNSNGNGHGPMCFVEFEDVSFATRALAELYGSQLPRANASNKGGIRLSFSKNPLGVRGPNNRRGNSSTTVNSPTTSNSGSNTGFTNYSYSAGYNKS